MGPHFLGRNNNRIVVAYLSFVMLTCMQLPIQADDDRLFESSIRPLLINHCLSCHGPDKQNGGLRLDSREAMIRGGESGPAIDTDHPERSQLLQAVLRSEQLAMPPEAPLSKVETEAVRRWVLSGAPWPNSSAALSSQTMAASHWAFQPIASVTLPQDFAGNPIDYFVDRKLKRSRLSPLSQADRRTVLRRLSYSLTGLPPSNDALQRFVSDISSNAYQAVVNAYLSSPQYGEHWARHWLDVARYSDTKGYVYGREERFWVHAWRYRDWVIDALNEDMPYDRFLLLQLAADQVADARLSDSAAMGFLTTGRRFLGVERDIIDDRIDVVTRGTMALTVSCARCHDHKYDPIPTADYYSLYGVFDSCIEDLKRINSANHSDAFESELKKRQQALATKTQHHQKASSNRARSRIRDYLFAQTELNKYPAKGFDQVFLEDDLLPAFVRRWESWLRTAKTRNDSVFLPWHLYHDIQTTEFPQKAIEVTDRLARLPRNIVNPLVMKRFSEAPSTFEDVIDRYAQLLSEIDRKWQATLQSSEDPKEESLSNPDAEQIRQILYGPESPTEVPHESIVHTESFFTLAECTELWKLQGEVDRWLIRQDAPPEFALMLRDRPAPSSPQVFLRGNPLTTGKTVPRQFLQVLSSGNRQPFRHGSGRRELAQAIVSPENPLTARVIVNRVWAHHFGQGLVRTTSDFGLRADSPTHPDLLDWLASDFIANGWSLKNLHRLIVTSKAFQRRSDLQDIEAATWDKNQADADNRLLWRMKPQRLTFEQFRDSMLTATGELDLSVGGKPTDLFDNPQNVRRSIYGLVDRQYLPAVLRVFDFANPDLHVPRRPQTTIPQQALFFLNHPLVLERVRNLDENLKTVTSTEQRVTQLFQNILGRSPTSIELNQSQNFLLQPAEKSNAERITAKDWRYGYGTYNEVSQRVEQFEALPHFTGKAWQGGPKWPDPKLGWVQLSAVGGHPGNSRNVASIRRWTAPQDMTINIESRLTNEPAQGDGIRGFIVHLAKGEMAKTKVHQSTAELNVKNLTVSDGDSVDFVVDIDAVLNNDQYLWSITITDAVSATSERNWNAERDFPRGASSERLTPFQQLAQILFCSNEFLFVD